MARKVCEVAPMGRGNFAVHPCARLSGALAPPSDSRRAGAHLVKVDGNFVLLIRPSHLQAGSVADFCPYCGAAIGPGAVPAAPALRPAAPAARAEVAIG